MELHSQTPFPHTSDSHPVALLSHSVTTSLQTASLGSLATTMRIMDSPRTALFRSAPELARVLLSDTAAAYILEKCTSPRWIGSGGYKEVVDLGNGSVARAFLRRHAEHEDPMHADHATTRFELLPYEVFHGSGEHVEIMPALLPATRIDAQHMESVLREHGLSWDDAFGKNAGRSQEIPHEILVYDGSVLVMGNKPSIRFYTACNEAGERQFSICAADDGSGNTLYFRAELNLHDPHAWTPDPFLRECFDNTPAVTGIWLQPEQREPVRRDEVLHASTMLDLAPNSMPGGPSAEYCAAARGQVPDSQIDVGSTPNPYVRAAFAIHGSEEMRAMLSIDPEPVVRRGCFMLAGLAGLRKRALEDGSPLVRSAAVAGSRDDTLREAVQHDPSLLVRLSAAKSASRDSTRELFLHDHNPEVRSAAVLHARSDHLRLALLNDPDAVVRSEAARNAIEDATRLAFLHDSEWLVRKSAVLGASDDVRIKCLNDPSEQVRVAAVNGMRSDSLRALFASDASDRVRIRTLRPVSDHTGIE